MTREQAARLRVWILCEDRLQERFFRMLLGRWGVERRNIDVFVAPSGSGAAEQWVRIRYPELVRKFRAKASYQRGLRLLAVRDGDAAGCIARKRNLDLALAESGQSSRGPDERIATPVPTWSIESWLLWLVDGSSVDEDVPMKPTFERRYPEDAEALRRAVEAWPGPDLERPMSLADGITELERLT